MQVTKTQFFNGAAIYAIPKLLSYLCTKSNPSSDQKIDLLRTKMAEIRKGIKQRIGDKAWFVFTDIIADNAWISFWVLAYLCRDSKLEFSRVQKVDIGSAFFGFCTVSWLVRYGLIHICPQLRAYIATRSFN